MKVSIFLIVCLLFMTNNLRCQNWSKISKDVKNEQLLLRPDVKIYIDSYFNLRSLFNGLEYIHISKRDTIFLLESHGDWSSLGLASIVWNSIDTISYISNDAGKSYMMVGEKLFTNYMMKLVSEWNVEEIRKEENDNGGGIPQYWVYATRIIINGKKYKIDCLYFKDFFNLERDCRI